MVRIHSGAPLNTNPPQAIFFDDVPGDMMKTTRSTSLSGTSSCFDDDPEGWALVGTQFSTQDSLISCHIFKLQICEIHF
ncbi:MAG: hypothetical protein OEY66_07815 [Gammaproteobacteria bacterium]|nr:hypothetical protein [Gammaproteobacteria bacterium]